jgi:tetratricopeptide (TPR) repeat protein
MMDLLNPASADQIFDALYTPSNSLEQMSNQALSNGIDLYMKEQYEDAAKEFKRSIGLSANSDYSVSATNYLAQTYLQLDDPKEAIKAYELGIQNNPNDAELHMNLGNLNFAEGHYEAAQEAYEGAVRLDDSASSRFALGQVFLKTNRLREAEMQFLKVKRLTPDATNGDYGLGLTYAKMEQPEKAIKHFEATLKIKKDFYDAHFEIGTLYADMGDMEKATEINDFLEDVDEDLADTLNRYIYKADPPKIAFARATGDFLYTMPPGTTLEAMDSYLANADASKTFTMEFQFDKEMDRTSVENIFNWRIGRSSNYGPGQAYNFGMSVPDTEVDLSPFPLYVTYDEKTLGATVYFNITQNEDGDGTIDPSHIEFKFSGEDKFGNSMNVDHDQFTGFNGVA